jgi:hypothetical protein
LEGGATGGDGAAIGAVALVGGATGAVTFEGGAAGADGADGALGADGAEGATGALGAMGEFGAVPLPAGALGAVPLPVGAMGAAMGALGAVPLLAVGADGDVVLLVELLVEFDCRKRPGHSKDSSYPSLPLRTSDANKAEIKTFIVESTSRNFGRLFMCKVVRWIRAVIRALGTVTIVR